MSDQNGNYGSKSMRVFNDCVVDPVWEKQGYCDNTCREYSPERPDNHLEPKKMYDVGTYAYSKLQLPSSTIKMSRANGAYTTNPPMSAASQGSQTGHSGQSSSTYSSSSGMGQGGDRVNYGTFANPDYKGKGTD